MTDEPKPTPEEEQAARLKDIARREKALGEELDRFEKETTRKTPDPPAVGGIVGT